MKKLLSLLLTLITLLSLAAPAYAIEADEFEVPADMMEAEVVDEAEEPAEAILPEEDVAPVDFSVENRPNNVISVVTHLTIVGLDLPVVGAHPDFSVIIDSENQGKAEVYITSWERFLGDDAYFNSDEWDFDDFERIDPSYTFQPGDILCVSFRGVPMRGCCFSTDLRVTVPGLCSDTYPLADYDPNDYFHGEFDEFEFGVYVSVLDPAPAVPSISYCTNTANGVKVAWKVNKNVDGYILYRNNANIGTFDTRSMANGETFTYVDTGATTNNYKYQYTLVAYKTVNGLKYKSTRSTTKGIYYMNAAPVEKLENTGSGVKLTWAKVSGSTGYKIYRDNTLVYTSKGASTVTWTDTGAKTNGTKYQYKVQCYKDYNGQTFTGVPGTNKTTYFLSKPSISTATNDTAGTVRLTWAKNGKATGYKVEYSYKSDFSSGVKSRVITTNTPNFPITGLSKGVTYYFRVTTQMKVGTATYASAVSAVKSLKLTK